MDKVKEITYQVFVKYLFWTLSGAIILMSFVSWWLAASSMKTQFGDNNKKITDLHNSVAQVAGKPPTQRYNEHSETGMQEKIAQRQRDVYVEWVKKYRRQREVLSWPDGLSQDFKDEVERILQKRPIEEKVEFDPTKQDQLVSRLREHYRNEIKSQLPSLAEKIGAHWEAADVGRGDSRGEVRIGIGDRGEDRFDREESDEPKDDAIVDWNPNNQSDIVLNHFDWSDQPSETPTTLQILYAQEDYQVFKALMQVIARTNVDETGQPVELKRDASVRYIDAIEIGRSAHAPSDTVDIPLGGEALEGPEGGPPPISTGGAEVIQGGYEGYGAEGEFADVDDPAEGRYVDKEYQPLPADKLRTAVDSKQSEEAYLAVAKRVPVRMRLTIDQRRLNRFLVECGNAELMLEIKQVRMSGGEGGDDKSLVRGRPAGGIRGPRRRDNEGASSDLQESPWDISIEVYGLIYIFNPPSLSRLEITADQAAEFRKKAGIEDDLSDIQPEPQPNSGEEEDEDEADADDQAALNYQRKFYLELQPEEAFS